MTVVLDDISGNYITTLKLSLLFTPVYSFLESIIKPIRKAPVTGTTSLPPWAGGVFDKTTDRGLDSLAKRHAFDFLLFRISNSSGRKFNIDHVILLVEMRHKNPWFDSAHHERFEVLYKKFATPLLKFIAKRIGANPEATEEVYQETMVAAWKGYKTFRHKSSYFTWLCRISLNKIADYYRDQVNENSHIVVPGIQKLLSFPSQEISPEERLGLEELKKSVNDCLNLLPYEARRLLWFRYWKDFSNQEIAKILGTSQRSVEGKLYRARANFASTYTRRFSREKRPRR